MTEIFSLVVPRFLLQIKIVDFTRTLKGLTGFLTGQYVWELVCIHTTHPLSFYYQYVAATHDDIADSTRVIVSAINNLGPEIGKSVAEAIAAHFNKRTTEDINWDADDEADGVNNCSTHFRPKK
jgi:hypothetical protein